MDGNLNEESLEAAKRKKNLRNRKQVNYNEEEGAVGQKRPASNNQEEERNRFANSSKRARFNYTQQLNSSNLSIHSQKGANLLHQAIHHTQE
jgi:hypothetical protein